MKTDRKEIDEGTGYIDYREPVIRYTSEAAKGRHPAWTEFKDAVVTHDDEGRYSVSPIKAGAVYRQSPEPAARLHSRGERRVVKR